MSSPPQPYFLKVVIVAYHADLQLQLAPIRHERMLFILHMNELSEFLNDHDTHTFSVACMSPLLVHWLILKQLFFDKHQLGLIVHQVYCLHKTGE